MDEMKKLLQILQDVNEDVDFASETRLVEEELIDSFDITSIISALDEAYGIHIEAKEISPENFNSAQAMMNMVNRYRG